MHYTYAELDAMSTTRLRILQFAYFCFLTDVTHAETAMTTIRIVTILRNRKERIFGNSCLLNVNSDPRWKLADNRKGENRCRDGGC